MSCRPAQDGGGGRRPPRGFVIGRCAPLPWLLFLLLPPFALCLSLNGSALVPAHRGPGSTHWVLSERRAGTAGRLVRGWGVGPVPGTWWLWWVMVMALEGQSTIGWVCLEKEVSGCELHG